MFKQKIFVAIIISLGFIIQACSQSTNEPSTVNEQSVTQKTNQIVTGTISSVNHISRGNKIIYEVRVTMTGGGIVKFEYLSVTGELLEIKGLSGPYNYEVSPGS